MPELPDIEATRRRFAAQALNRTIAEVDLRDPERLRGAGTADLQAALTGYRFEQASRHGKVLFAKVSCGWWLVVHFGMTGALIVCEAGEDLPDYARLVLRFEDGGALVYDDRRRLGWVELTDSPEAYLRSQGIGPDALAMADDALARLLAGARGGLKGLLTDQDKIAGIGNVYADEVLFQAGLDPRRKADSLSQDEAERLTAALRQVLTQAADLDAEPERFPSDWLIPRREGDGRCPHCGGALEAPKINGRTSYLCPRCQR